MHEGTTHQTCLKFITTTYFMGEKNTLNGKLLLENISVSILSLNDLVSFIISPKGYLFSCVVSSTPARINVNL